VKVKEWALQVLVLAVAFSLFFGVVAGKRGLTLVVFVGILSLFLPTVIWATRNRLARK
jgi:hypothetical protein